MPATFDREIMARAKQMYTQDGEKPSDIVRKLGQELALGRLTVPGKNPYEVRLPESPTTITRWARKYGWHPHWKEALKQLLSRADPEAPFGVSGIKDPILHLAQLEAHKFAFRFTVAHPESTDQQILAETIVHVSQKLDPGPVVLHYLEPLIRQEIPDARNAEWKLVVSPLTEDERQERLREVTATAQTLLRGEHL